MSKYTDRLIDAEDRLTVPRGQGIRGGGEDGEGSKKYGLVVTEGSQGCEVRHREHTQ